MFSMPSEKVTNPELLKEEFQTKQMRKMWPNTTELLSTAVSLASLTSLLLPRFHAFCGNFLMSCREEHILIGRIVSRHLCAV